MNICQYSKARYPYLWLSTTEEERIIRQHRDLLKPEAKTYRWDLVRGFYELQNGEGSSWTWKGIEGQDTDNPQPTGSPAEALIRVLSLAQNFSSSNDPVSTIIYMCDFQKFWKDAQVCRTALNIKDGLKNTARMVVFLSCETASAIPPDLKNDITPYAAPMPTGEELKAVVKRAASDNGLKEPEAEELSQLANSLIGLTEEGAENSLALCLVTLKRFDVKFLLKEKARLIESVAGLTYSDFQESLDDLVGHENLIQYVKKAAPNPDSNAVCLYGPPGVGKSHVAKATGNALGWPVVGFNFNNIRTKYQGETEQALEKALSTIEALGRCVVFCDEVDKAIAGSQGGADADGGTGSRIVGRLLSYFEDKKPNGSYWMMTCNSLTDILTISGGALVRRFDAIFYLDMPTEAEGKGIAKLWGKKLGVDIPPGFPLDGMTGADIKKLAKTQKLLSCSAEEARKYVIPTKQALGPRLDEIKKAASSVCIPSGRIVEKSLPSKGRKLDL
jgi:hypothetical protein